MRQLEMFSENIFIERVDSEANMYRLGLMHNRVRGG